MGNHQATAPKKPAVKKAAPKKVKKVKKVSKTKVHHEEHIHVDLPHATREHRRASTSPLDILNADPEQSHDASGASLTSLASNMLTASTMRSRRRRPRLPRRPRPRPR